MPKIIKVKCNGPNHCVNEVDLEQVVDGGNVNAFRIITPLQKVDLLDRYVLDCKHCAAGKVVLLREAIEKYL